MGLSRGDIIGLVVGFCSLVAGWLAISSGAGELGSLLMLPAILLYFWWMIRPSKPPRDEEQH